MDNIKDIKRVFIFDDDELTRNGSLEVISEIGFEGIPVVKPETDVAKLIRQIGDSSGLFCDYHLKMHQYACFNGDQIVAAAYNASKPALLCTSYTNFDASLSREIRRYIPIILAPEDLQDIDCIINGFDTCINELKGKFTPKRKPWRALVRIEEVDAENMASYVVIPKWHTDSKVQVFWDDFPDELKPAAKREGHRFHAMVNLDNEHLPSLYLSEWEAS